MRKKLLLLLSCLPLFACQNSTLDQEKEERLENKILFQTAKELKRERGLEFYGFGGDSGDEMKTKTIALSFISYKKMNIEQARELMVYVVEKLLKNFNAHEELKPFLCNFPFTFKNTQISIFFHNRKDQSRFESPCLCSVVQHSKGVDYEVYHSETKKFNIIHKEPYPEAYQKVFGKKLILPKETIEKPCSSLVPENKSLIAPK